MFTKSVKILPILVVSLFVFSACGAEEPEMEKKVTVYNDTTVRGQIDDVKVEIPRVAMRGSLSGYYASELQSQPIIPDAKSVINAKAGNYPGPEYPYVPTQGLRVDTTSHDGYIENLNISGPRHEGYIETAGYTGRECDGYIECVR